MESPQDILRQVFGYQDFHPLQGRVVQHVVAGNDALVLMPTGGGKSLCFQVPALCRPGLTLVISPLVALMRDQVAALQANGVAAAYLNSSQTSAESAVVLGQLSARKLKLLYISPENFLPAA